MFNGIVGTIMMLVAVALTIYSLILYMRNFGGIFASTSSRETPRHRAP
jgi:hypothetical protein